MAFYYHTIIIGTILYLFIGWVLMHHLLDLHFNLPNYSTMYPSHHFVDLNPVIMVPYTNIIELTILFAVTY